MEMLKIPTRAFWQDRRMNDEARMPNDKRNSNDEVRSDARADKLLGYSCLVIPSSFGIRASSFLK
jgi:hypothetical protein